MSAVAGLIDEQLCGRSARRDAGWAWAGANFWRATFDRIGLLQRGGRLDFGSAELRFVSAELVVSLLCLAIGIVLVVRAPAA
jgi:hypothetical protein